MTCPPVEESFRSDIRARLAHAYAVYDQSRAAALADLESLMMALRLSERERMDIRAYATPERLYHPRLVREVILRFRSAGAAQ